MAHKGQGWHGEPRRHAEAAKGDKTTSSQPNAKGRGWHGDSTGHSEAAKGEDIKGKKSLMDKLKGE